MGHGSLGSHPMPWEFEGHVGFGNEDRRESGRQSCWGRNWERKCWSIQGILSGVIPSCKPAPFGSAQIIVDESIITSDLHSLHVSKGTMIDPWPPPRNVFPGIFFMSNFVIYIWSNGPFCTLYWLVELVFTDLKSDDVHPCLLYSLDLGCHGWLCSSKNLCDLPLIKALDSETQMDFPAQDIPQISRLICQRESAPV